MSHLAGAEEPDNPLNAQQRAALRGSCARCCRAAPASLANSSGIFLGPAFHYDLCRPGVALYGVNPTPGRANPMAPVVTLEAPVLQVHEVAAGRHGRLWRDLSRPAPAHAHRDGPGRLRRRLPARRERPGERPDRGRAGAARRAGCRWT